MSLQRPALQGYSAGMAIQQLFTGMLYPRRAMHAAMQVKLSEKKRIALVILSSAFVLLASPETYRALLSSTSDLNEEMNAYKTVFIAICFIIFLSPLMVGLYLIEAGIITLIGKISYFPQISFLEARSALVVASWISLIPYIVSLLIFDVTGLAGKQSDSTLLHSGLIGWVILIPYLAFCLAELSCAYILRCFAVAACLGFICFVGIDQISKLVSPT